MDQRKGDNGHRNYFMKKSLLMQLGWDSNSQAQDLKSDAPPGFHPSFIFKQFKSLKQDILNLFTLYYQTYGSLVIFWIIRTFVLYFYISYVLRLFVKCSYSLLQPVRAVLKNPTTYKQIYLQNTIE